MMGIYPVSDRPRWRKVEHVESHLSREDTHAQRGGFEPSFQWHQQSTANSRICYDHNELDSRLQSWYHFATNGMAICSIFFSHRIVSVNSNLHRLVASSLLAEFRKHQQQVVSSQCTQQPKTQPAQRMATPKDPKPVPSSISSSKAEPSHLDSWIFPTGTRGNPADLWHFVDKP